MTEVEQRSNGDVAPPLHSDKEPSPPPPTNHNGDAAGKEIPRHALEQTIEEDPGEAEAAEKDAVAEREKHQQHTNLTPSSAAPPPAQGITRASTTVHRPSPLRHNDSDNSSNGDTNTTTPKPEFDAAKMGSIPATRPLDEVPRSPISQSRPLSRQTSLTKVQHDAPPTLAGPRRKPSLIKRLSGINLFGGHHHHPKEKEVKADADLKAAQAKRHNYELTHPRTGDKSTPAESATTTSRGPARAATFSLGDSHDASPAGTPPQSHNPSRQPSSENVAKAVSRASLKLDTSSAGTTPGPSSALETPTAYERTTTSGMPSADEPRPGRLRSSSTFNLFKKKDSAPSEPVNIRRPASFSHGLDLNGGGGGGAGSQPSSMISDTPMSELSRTLSKSSLARGDGWGHITGQLPRFDHIYHYVEAESKFPKINKKLKGQIGEGAGGVVRTAQLKHGKRPTYSQTSTGGDLGLFAVKTFAKRRDNENEGFYCAKLVREFRVHCALTHDNIVRLADICVEEHKFGETSFVAVMDYCIAGDLFDIHWHPYNAIDQGIMGKAEKYCCYKQLMFAVNYMHQQGIAHRDIKLENVLVNGHGQIKLADFGTSVFTVGPDREDCRGVVGTDHSIPPEAYLSGSKQGPAYDGLKADIWACACVFHFLTFDNDSPMAALNAYPFGESGATPDNKLWQKYMNSLKRFEPSKYIPGHAEALASRKTSSASSSVFGSSFPTGASSSGTSPPGSPAIGGGGPPRRQDSIMSHTSQTSHSSTPGLGGGPSLEQNLMSDDWEAPSSPEGGGQPTIKIDDNFDPMRKRNPFCRLPASSFTSMKGMLDPNPDTRWTARQVIDDHFFQLIDCCQVDSNPDGFKAPPPKKQKGNIAKVHNHVRPPHRKLMESSLVEQQRNDQHVKEMRRHG